MVGSISNANNNISSVSYVQKAYDSSSTPCTNKPLSSFDDEDQAIISADAKLQYEQEKYNSGKSDPVDLAVTRVTSENQVDANVQVVKTKSQMLQAVLGLNDEND